MYLNALENERVPDLETLSLNYLPDRVPLATEIIQPTTSNQSPNQAPTNYKSPIAVTNADLPIEVEPNEAKQSPNEAKLSPNEAKQSPNEAKQSPKRGKTIAKRGKTITQRSKAIVH